MPWFNSIDYYDEHTKRHGVQIECEKCDFRCKNDTTLRKHINTKHAAIVGLGKDITEKKKNIAIEGQEEINHFKYETCSSKFISDTALLKHNKTKHQASQKLQEETKYPICGKTIRNGHDVPSYCTCRS